MSQYDTDPEWTTAVWKTAQEICGAQAGQSLTVNIASTDITQGSLGNCWAIAAISTLAQYAADKDDYNQDIAGMFLTKEYQPTKPVDIQLYDWDEATRELTRRVISVPDSFPYNTVDDKPLCASPKDGSEDVWVMFLEAALAMLWSKKSTLDLDAYKKLNMGLGFRALRAMTGIKWADRIFCVGQTEDSLGQWYVDHQATGEETAVEPEHLWRILLEAHQAGEVLNAGTGDINRDGSAVDTNAVNGMAEQHEYSITKVYVNEDGERIVGLRNPWGKLVREGADEADLRQYAKVTGPDGRFELAWDDFLWDMDYVGVVNRVREGCCLDHTPCEEGEEQEQLVQQTAGLSVKGAAMGGKGYADGDDEYEDDTQQQDQDQDEFEDECEDGGEYEGECEEGDECEDGGECDGGGEFEEGDECEEEGEGEYEQGEGEYEGECDGEYEEGGEECGAEEYEEEE